MPRLGSVCSLLALGTVLTLAGCGSGSDSSTPNNGSQATPPPVATGTDTISISGQVTDMPIVNAVVTVTVDGQVFTANAPTDSEGNFTVDIASDDPNAIVVMEASDPATGIHFTAVLDDFSGFEGKADADGSVVDTDITNVTTAHYLLAINASDDGSIDDAAELDETSGLVDPAAVLQLAAAIKLVVENIEGVTLPAGVSNTQALAAAILDGSSTFLDDVAVSAPGALDTAIDLVVNDGNATLAWDSAKAPGVYLHRNGKNIYTLYADGTGQAASFEHDGVTNFQWAVNDEGKLLVAHMDNSGTQDLVTILSRHRNALTVMVEEQDASGDSMTKEPTTINFFPFATGFTDDTVAGTYSTMGEPGHVKVFSADHTGYDLDVAAGDQSGFFTWEVDGDGNLYIISADGTLAHRATVLSENDNDGMLLLVGEYNPTGQLGSLDVIRVRHSDVVAADPTDVSDLDFHLAGNTYAWFDDNEISLFRFRADGALRQVSQTLGSDGAEFESRLGEWSMANAATIRTWFPGADGHEDATVVDGLGADFMSVQTAEDAATGAERVATRIVPIEISDVAGAYYYTDENGQIQAEFVQMNMNFTGEFWVNGVLAKTFDWAINEHGSLLIKLHSDDAFNNETLTLHMLAGSDVGGNMHFVMVRRLNGQLYADDATNVALRIVHIWREG